MPSMVPVLSFWPNSSFHYQYQSVSANSSCYRCPSRFSAQSNSVHCIHITQQTFQIPFLLITFCITCLQSTRTSISYENIVRFSQDCLRSILVGHFQSRENEKIRNSPLVTHYIQVNQFARQYNRAPKPPICE